MRDRAPPAPVQPQFRDQRDRAPSYGFQDRAPNGSYREEPGEVYKRAAATKVGSTATSHADGEQLPSPARLFAWNSWAEELLSP